MIDFNKLIDSFLSREISRKSIGRYYPSEIGGCLRKTWYSYKQPKPADTALIKVFHAGNMLHEFVGEVMKSEKNPNIELLQSEIPVKLQEKDFLISGRIDDLILAKIENKEVLVEIKSCKYLPREFKSENEMQLQLYMRAIGVHNGLLLYIQKDNLETREFEIVYDEEKAEKIIERFKKLHLFLTEDKLPKAEAKHDQDKIWLCERCPWKKECWDRGD